MGSERKTAGAPGGEQATERTAEVSTLTTEELKSLVHDLFDKSKEKDRLIGGQLQRIKKLESILVQITAVPGSDPDQQALAEINRQLYRLEQDYFLDEFKLQRKEKRLIRRFIARLRALIDELEVRLRKKDPAWMTDLSPMLRGIIRYIKIHSMDLTESKDLIGQKGWPTYSHILESGKNQGEAVEYPRILFRAPYEDMKRTLGITDVNIRYYLNALCRVGCGFKLGKEGKHGQIIYSFAYHNGNRRIWHFSGRKQRELEGLQLQKSE